MEERTFHYFAFLPAELRLMIWNEAVRDGSSGFFNFFTILSAGKGKTLNDCQSVRFGPPSSDGNCLGCTTVGQSCWEHDQKFGGMMDSGLWEACRESRAVMERRFPTSRRPDSNNYEPVTGLATNRCGVTRRYTFVPAKDMFAFDTKSFITAFQDPDREIDCVFNIDPRPSALQWLFDFGWSLFNRQTPRPFERAPRPVRLRDLGNIAIELDPQWLSMNREERIMNGTGQVLDAIAKIALKLPQSTSIYLYDHGLPGLSPGPEPRTRNPHDDAGYGTLATARDDQGFDQALWRHISNCVQCGNAPSLSTKELLDQLDTRCYYFGRYNSELWRRGYGARFDWLDWHI